MSSRKHRAAMMLISEITELIAGPCRYMPEAKDCVICEIRRKIREFTINIKPEARA